MDTKASGRQFRRFVIFLLAAVYLILWAFTAAVGIPQVDEAFDRELAVGSAGMGSGAKMLVKRVPFFDSSEVDPHPESVRGVPWRCRSAGFAVAPFLIIDEVAWQQHALSGFGGMRLVFWYPGHTRWFVLKRYWVS